ncbi:hypothetical protein [Bordetella petrii]|uniref:hypothetical protein n=1 Tax=Bordetella petrii TaxID=94624 RepID=UPI00048A659E|nr:hypothetical protein [Bordetella petrii]
MSRSDPIRTNYFDAVQKAEKAIDCLFYLNALLSFCTLLVEQKTHPSVYDVVLLLFSISVVAMFALGMMLRLYLTPRAEDKRRQDFFSSACNVNLIHQQTDGYYNNDFKDPIKRMAAQVLENSLFSKEIALRMVRRERVKVAVYAVVWLVLLHNRPTDLGWLVAASQAIFSEQILSKLFRLEWLRIRFEKTFEDVFRLFQTKPSTAQFNAHALDALSMYETAKANAGITLSSTIFDDLNPTLSTEWDKVKATLKI